MLTTPIIARWIGCETSHVVGWIEDGARTKGRQGLVATDISRGLQRACYRVTYSDFLVFCLKYHFKVPTSAEHLFRVAGRRETDRRPT